MTTRTIDEIAFDILAANARGELDLPLLKMLLNELTEEPLRKLNEIAQMVAPEKFYASPQEEWFAGEVRKVIAQQINLAPEIEPYTDDIGAL